MIVLDASAAVDWLLRTPAGQRVEQRIYSRNDTLHTVHLLDVEFAQVLRRLVREGTLARKRAEEAMEDLMFSGVHGVFDYAESSGRSRSSAAR